MSVKSQKTSFGSLKTFLLLHVRYQSQTELHFRGNPAQFCSIPAGVPRHSFPSPGEPRNISFHPRGILAGSAGFPRSPSPCRFLHYALCMAQLQLSVAQQLTKNDEHRYLQPSLFCDFITVFFLQKCLDLIIQFRCIGPRNNSHRALIIN